MLAVIASAVVLVGSVVPGHPLDMRTVQQFGKNDTLRVWVYVNGREVGPSETGPCVAYYYSRGTSIRLSSCGRGPLKVRATSMRPTRVRVRAEPIFR